MSRFIIALAVASAAAFAAPAAHRAPVDDEARAAKALAGLVPGEPQSCIHPSLSESSDHFGNVVLMRDRSGVLYRANFQGGCTANEWDTLITRRFSSQLCRGDIAEVQNMTNGVSSGACSFADFVPYRRVKPAR